MEFFDEKFIAQRNLFDAGVALDRSRGAKARIKIEPEESRDHPMGGVEKSEAALFEIDSTHLGGEWRFWRGLRGDFVRRTRRGERGRRGCWSNAGHGRRLSRGDFLRRQLWQAPFS